SSDDPFAAPVIDPNYLAEETDRIVMRDAFKMVRDIVAQKAFNSLRGKEYLPGTQVQSDAEIDAYVRSHGETIYHPVGTVSMGATDAAPLDSELKLRGVEALRVVDASVMPTLVGGNTNAPTIMVAEKAADLILGRRQLPAEDAPVVEAV
ncbi:MAG: GMC oxidoreductase, partial [Pseudomonadota bacterium]